MTAQGLPEGWPVALDPRVRVRRGAAVVLGGAPWGVVRIAPAGRPFVQRLYDAGPRGLTAETDVEHAVVDLLLARGIVHPLPWRTTRGRRVAPDVEIVIPAYERAHLLDTCLASLRSASPGVRVVVVDDASSTPAVGAVAARHGARLVRRPVNGGPAAARNTGLRETSASVVAFVDADCIVTPGWLDALLPHFDDPRVGAVAPRVSPRAASDGLLARHELARSALDMGPRAELVKHGAPLGFLPSATLLVRRSALADDAGTAFDEEMRLGEDVDLVWRLLERGWLVRYEPAASIFHEMRLQPLTWARRRFEYGTSAADLDRRHPGRLAPARLSGWNVAAVSLVLARRPLAGSAVAAVAAGLLARKLQSASVDPTVAPLVVGKGLVADAVAVGHALRREWCPLGWLALAAAPRSRVARLAAFSMLAPVVFEWLTRRPQVDLPRYVALRLVEDAAYGGGVIASAVRGRRPGVLLPRVSLPRLRGGRRQGPDPRPGAATSS